MIFSKANSECNVPVIIMQTIIDSVCHLVSFQSIYKSRSEADPHGKAAEIAREIFSKADDNKDNKLSEAEFVKHSSHCTAIQELLQAF